MRRTTKVLIAALVAVSVAAGGGFCYVKGNEYSQFVGSQRFGSAVLEVNGTSVDVSGMDADTAYQKYLDAADGMEMDLVLNGDRTSINLEGCYTRTLSPDDLAACIADVSFMDWLFGKPSTYVLDDHVEYSGGAGEKTREIVNNGDYGFEEAEDAYFDMDSMTIVPEKQGTQIDPDKAAALVEQAVQDGETEVEIGEQDIYIKPSISKEDIEEKFAGVIRMLGWSVTYPDYDYTIRTSDYKDYVHIREDGSYDIDDSFLADAVLALSKKVDRTYDSIKFQSVKDGEITVNGGTYGQIMDNSKEVAFLKEKLKAGESMQGRTPVWKCQPIHDGKLPDEYIEVDISAQHVWHFKDGKVCCETDCVTGTHSLHRDTPTGAYFISEKVNGKYLVGDGYRTWVNKWMRLTNSGIGLHDATWRARFGGSIYQTSGSHGCINLPLGFASKLYDESHVGMLVVVHQ